MRRATKTPFIRLFYDLSDRLLLAEKLVYRVKWLRDNWYAVHQKLKVVDDQLAAQMLQAMEGHPSAPFGLSSLDVEAMCLCRIVDSFQRILVEFVGEIFKSKPETLIPAISEKVDAADVLRCATLDEFRQRMAAKALRRLGGFEKTLSFMQRLGVDIGLDESTAKVVTEAIAIRNIIVHNGGCVNEEFLQMTGRTDVKVGYRVSVDEALFVKSDLAIRSAADAIQIALGSKYFGVAESQLFRWHSTLSVLFPKDGV